MHTNPGNASAVVIGLSPTGLGAVRSLDKSLSRDVPIIGVCESIWPAGAYTRLCDKKYYCQGFGSPKLIENLIELGRRFSVKPILLLTDDMTVLLVSRHRQRLSPYYHLLLPTNDVVELLVDKTRFALYAKENEFPVPRTWVINDKDDLEKASEEIRFPCFLKPRYRNEQWLKRAYPKGFRSKSREDLMPLYDMIHSTEEHYVLQEWIEGPDSELHMCQVLFDDNSRCIASFTCRKLRQWPTEAGIACMAEPIYCPEIEKETIRLFESLQLKGLGAVEFKRDARDNRYKMIEPRIGRVGTLSEIATANGVNFPLLTYAYLTKMNVSENPVREPVRWVQEEGDVQSCLHLMRNKKLSLRELVRSYAGPKCFALFSWKDPLPLVATILKDLRGNESGTLWSSIRGGERAGRPSAVVEAVDFLNKRS
jgi:predicted ATP-grasp superfamily ATP-dependent carboligase